jgi:hypothetical protein
MKKIDEQEAIYNTQSAHVSSVPSRKIDVRKD